MAGALICASGVSSHLTGGATVECCAAALTGTSMVAAKEMIASLFNVRPLFTKPLGLGRAKAA